jgi:hypothetical protein
MRIVKLNKNISLDVLSTLFPDEVDVDNELEMLKIQERFQSRTLLKCDLVEENGELFIKPKGSV